jgi:hypothetical protein
VITIFIASKLSRLGDELPRTSLHKFGTMKGKWSNLR